MTRSCRLEIEADKQVKLRELELNAAKYAPVPAVSSIQTADALVGGESPEPPLMRVSISLLCRSFERPKSIRILVCLNVSHPH